VPVVAANPSPTRRGPARGHRLEELKEAPEADTPSLRRVRQSRTYPVLRVSHPYRDGIAIRLIVWFPPDDPPVVILFANDKASMDWPASQNPIRYAGPTLPKAPEQPGDPTRQRRPEQVSAAFGVRCCEDVLLDHTVDGTVLPS